MPIRISVVVVGISGCYRAGMNQHRIAELVSRRADRDGLIESGIRGVQLFRVTESIRCAPAVYEPTVVAILSGTKEAILDGQSHLYDNSRYLCCTLSMPVEAGTPTASPDNPLLGVFISLDTRVMTELAIEMESASGAIRPPDGGPLPPGLALAEWDPGFTDALWRLLELGDSAEDTAVLGESRLRELYYAVLKGEAGLSARRAFGVGNEIARSIAYLASHLGDALTIEDMAAQAGMSRAVFHRKFKQATTLSPIQFIKAMRLNTAAMQIAAGQTVFDAARAVGYASASQFSREFKRQYGQSPREWGNAKALLGTVL